MKKFESNGRPIRPEVSQETISELLSRLATLEEKVAQMEYTADRERQERAFRDPR